MFGTALVDVGRPHQVLIYLGECVQPQPLVLLPQPLQRDAELRRTEQWYVFIFVYLVDGEQRQGLAEHLLIQVMHAHVAVNEEFDQLAQAKHAVDDVRKVRLLRQVWIVRAAFDQGEVILPAQHGGDEALDVLGEYRFDGLGGDH